MNRTTQRVSNLNLFHDEECFFTSVRDEGIKGCRPGFSMRNLTRLLLGKGAATAAAAQSRRQAAPRSRKASRKVTGANERRVEQRSNAADTGAGMGEAVTRLVLEKGGLVLPLSKTKLGKKALNRTEPVESTEVDSLRTMANVPSAPRTLDLFEGVEESSASVPQALDSGMLDADVLESGVYVASPADAAKGSLSQAAPGQRFHTGRDIREASPELVRQVTLVVYEWHNVEPGTLWWVFPSVQAALSAARAMKNAVKWAVITGKRTAKVDVEVERQTGQVIAEQAG